MATFNNGGWYKNPATGRVQQYWNGAWYDQPVTGTVGGRNYEKDPLGSLPGDPGHSSTQNPLEQVNAAIENSFKKLQDEVVKKFGEYRNGQPFNVDKVLAEKTKSAAEQIDPYYNQLIGDYLTGVERKISRGANDTRDLLAELGASSASYADQAQLSLQRAGENAAQGYADSGLYGSGEQLRTEGQLKQATGSDLADYTRRADIQKKQVLTNQNRNIEDTNLAKNSYLSNLGQNRYTDVSTRAGQLTKEAGQQYIQGFQQTLPPQLQSASGFDMLKSLGIYS